MDGPTNDKRGARFFDDKRRDLGWASHVTKRSSVISTLTVFDVGGAEPALARALSLLDRSRLRIQCDDAEETSYEMTWASGYSNGDAVRLQGVLATRGFFGA